MQFLNMQCIKTILTIPLNKLTCPKNVSTVVDVVIDQFSSLKTFYLQLKPYTHKVLLTY